MNINQQIAIKGAELLGYEKPEFDGHFVTYRVFVPKYGQGTKIFDPANSASDMNKLIEAFKIDVVFNSEWIACVDLGVDTVEHRSKSRDEAIRECVIKALGLHKDSEALGVDND